MYIITPSFVFVLLMISSTVQAALISYQFSATSRTNTGIFSGPDTSVSVTISNDTDLPDTNSSITSDQLNGNSTTGFACSGTVTSNAGTLIWSNFARQTMRIVQETLDGSGNGLTDRYCYLFSFNNSFIGGGT